MQGNTLVPQADLLARLEDLVGKEVTFSELEAAAGRLTEVYARRGFVARAVLPQQEIRDGTVTFRVIEGVRGPVSVQPGGSRVQPARVERFIERRVPAGRPLDVGALGEALAILNDQPGVDLSVAMAPGRGEGEIGLRVTAADAPLARWTVGVNNRGSRSTGSVEALAGVVLANPTGRFDEASLLLNASEGVSYLRGGYSLAAGDSGLRLGVNASALRYEVRDSAFAALQPRGTGQTIGLTSSYPISRQETHGLSLIASTELRALKDRTVAGETGDRVLKVATVGVDGYTAVAAGPLAGQLTYGAGLTAGDADQRNAAALAADLAGRRTQGSFTKLGWTAGYQQAFGQWSAGLRGRGQLASKNLDSSERLSLGGPAGVRAYPVGEAVGDEGWLATASASFVPAAGLRLGVFYDAGRITVNHTVPAAGMLIPNRYSLSGAGVSVEWAPVRNAVLGLVVATPTGSNPGRDALGRNADGSRSSAARAWVSLTAQF